MTSPAYCFTVLPQTLICSVSVPIRLGILSRLPSGVLAEAGGLFASVLLSFQRSGAFQKSLYY